MKDLNNIMEYKGYYTKVIYSSEDNAFIGKLENATGVVLFDAQSILEFEKAFHDSVDDYINACEEFGMEN